MSHSAKKKSPKRRGGSCLLGCFGFPHSDDDDAGDISKENSKPYLDGNNNNNTTRVSKGRNWSWARNKQRSATKTVPLDATTVPKKPGRSWRKDVNNMLKRNKNKWKTSSQPLVNHVNSVPSPAPETAPAAQKLSDSRPNETRSNSDQHIILGNNRRSFKTNLDVIEEATTSQENLQSPTRNATIATGKALGDSVSLPLIIMGSDSGGEPPTPARKSKGTIISRVDTVVGMSIILVMLMVILQCGKVCAILCTSAWFYFVFKFRINYGATKGEKNGSSSRMGDQN